MQKKKNFSRRFVNQWRHMSKRLPQIEAKSNARESKSTIFSHKKTCKQSSIDMIRHSVRSSNSMPLRTKRMWDST